MMFGRDNSQTMVGNNSVDKQKLPYLDTFYVPVTFFYLKQPIPMQCKTDLHLILFLSETTKLSISHSENSGSMDSKYKDFPSYNRNETRFKKRILFYDVDQYTLSNT